MCLKIALQVPSAEQVHIAGLLSDSLTPDDIQERIAEVLSVVSQPEEAILIALHDHDYNVHKTCEALLDSSSNIQVRWYRAWVHWYVGIGTLAWVHW